MENKRHTPAFIGVPDELVIPGSVNVLIAALAGLIVPDKLHPFYFRMLILVIAAVSAWFIVVSYENWKYFNEHSDERRPSLLRSCLTVVIGLLLLIMSLGLTIGQLLK